MDYPTDELVEVAGALPIGTTGRLPDLVEQAWADSVQIAARWWTLRPGRDPRRATVVLVAARP